MSARKFKPRARELRHDFDDAGAMHRSALDFTRALPLSRDLAAFFSS
jgi:hypothetical protein